MHPFYGEHSFFNLLKKSKIIEASQEVAKIVEFSWTLYSEFHDNIFHNLDIIKFSK